MSYEFFIVQLKQQGAYLPGEVEHTQIDDIDNNGYLVNAEEDETDPINVFDQSIRHVLKHLQSLRYHYDDSQDTYTQWVKTQNVEDFESKWEDKKKYHTEEDTWLSSMYNLRHYWVKAHLKDTFFARMTNSGRSESMHSFFDGFVNSKTILHDFVQQYDKAISSRRGAEKDQDFRTLNSKPTLHGDHPIEAMAEECYTRKIYEIFRKEWKASFDCGHKKVIKDSCYVTYRVGYLQGNMENWKIVKCKKHVIENLQSYDIITMDISSITMLDGSKTQMLRILNLNGEELKEKYHIDEDTLVEQHYNLRFTIG
ncbi:FAR1-related sequence 5-like protein [Tanacetum coccineum]